jgi:hypothetical protein
MKIYGLLFTFILMAQIVFANEGTAEFSGLQSFLNCESAADHSKAIVYYRSLTREVEERHRFEDISEKSSLMRRIEKTCNINKWYAIPEEFLQRYETEGYLAESQRLISRMKLRSQYGDVSDDAQKYFSLISKAKGKASEEVQDFIKKGYASAAAQKETCKPVDLRKSLPPVRDQDGVGWCYAYAGADLVSHKLGQNISPVDIAIQYNDTFKNRVHKYLGKTEDQLTAGYVDKALVKAMNRGFCAESGFSGDNIQHAQLASALAAIEKLKRRSQRKLNCDEFLQVKSTFKNLSQYEVDQILEKSTNMSFIADLNDANCKKRLVLPAGSSVKALRKRAENGRDIVDRLDQVLDSKNIAALSYNFALIIKNESTAEPLYHASSIVGRSWNESKKRCEYILRNSFGRTCYIRPDLACTEGYIYVPRDEVANYSTELNYIE